MKLKFDDFILITYDYFFDTNGFKYKNERYFDLKGNEITKPHYFVPVSFTFYSNELKTYLNRSNYFIFGQSGYGFVSSYGGFMKFTWENN